MQPRRLPNCVAGARVESQSADVRDLLNPATNERLAQVPLATAEEAAQAVEAAERASWGWHTAPPVVRAAYMFRLKALLEARSEEIAELITRGNGKTIGEARGEMRRTIENVDAACGIPSLMMGHSTMPVPSLEDCYPIIAASSFGNAASHSTDSGKAVRDFTCRVGCGNIGVNMGVAAPVAFLPSGGTRASFFGVLHGQGRDAVEFFADKKVVMSRWF